MPTPPARTAYAAPRRPAAPPVRQPGAPPTTLSAEAALRDKLDQDQFEKQAREYAVPTSVRPALITAAEVDRVRAGYGTGAGQLDVLRKVISAREAVWDEMNGLTPFDPPSDDARAKAVAFFQANGTRLAGAPREAPPNPIRVAAESAAAAKQAPQAPAAPARPAAPPTAAPAATPPAESTPAPAPPAQPEPRPGTRGDVAMPPPASLEFQFVSAAGFLCRLTLNAFSGIMVLEQGQAAERRLVEQGAKPLPQPTPAVVVQPPAQAAGAKAAESNGGEHKCKYHGKAMKPSKNPSELFCPAKMADGSYCDYKVTI